jgi:hypothetical protein
MSDRQPHSLRTRLTLQAYLTAYSECVGRISSDDLYHRAQRYVDKVKPPLWGAGLARYYYRHGWLDRVRGKPCQPFPPKESEEQA